MAVTADWRWAVSGLEDKTVRVWDLETGQCVRTLAGHTDSVSGLAVTADGRLVVSASADGTLRVWNLGRGKCLRILKGHMDWVSAVAVTADGQRAVSGSKDKTVRVWNLETGECVRTLTGHTDWVDVVTLAADGRRVVTESDLELKVWDVETGVCLCTLAGHTALMDRMVRRCCGGDLLRTLAGYTGVKRPVALSADGRCGVLRSDDKTLRVWDLAAGALLASFEGAGAMAVFAATPDGCTLVGGDEDGSVHLLRLENVEPGPTHITATRLWRSGVEWDTELSAACPRCGQRFAVSRALLGTETACPHCAGALRVNPLAYDPDPALLAPDIPAEQPSPVTRTAAAPYVICRADLERVAYGWLAIPLAVAAVAWGLTRLTPRLWLCAGPLLIQAALAVLSLLVVRWGSCPSCRQPLVVLPGQHRVKCFACQTKIQVIG
jgi:LSD1 subclass zinc finger protein